VKKVVKEKEFPKQWRIKVTEENRNMLNQYKLSKGTMKLNEHWDWVAHTGNAFHSDAVANYKSYPIITTEQFRNHVLNSTPKEAEKWIPKVGEWCYYLGSEAGGIDSLHWKKGVVAKFEKLISNEQWEFTTSTGTYSNFSCSNYSKSFRKAEPHEIPTENKPSEPTEVETLKAELEFEKEQLNIFKSNFAEAEKENVELKKENNNLKGYKEWAVSEINNYRKEVVDRENEANELRKKLNTFSDTINKHEAKIDSLHKEIETITKYGVEQIKLILKNE
jgi:hypothetical protein